MKRIICFSVAIALGLAFLATPAFSQSNLTESKFVRNTGSDTLWPNTAVKIDTAYEAFVVIDTLDDGAQDYVTWVAAVDTAGRADANVGLLSDSLGRKTGGGYQLSMYAVTSATSDTVVIYGDTLVDFTRSDRSYSKAVDTVLLSTTVPVFSDPVWFSIDSIILWHYNAGVDTVHILKRHPFQVTVSDSLTDLFAGVVAADSIAPDSAGAIITIGITEVYVDGGTRTVEVGQALYTDINGKLSPPEQPITEIITPTIYSDTVRLDSEARRAIYVSGVDYGTPVFSQPRRELAATTGDTVRIWSLAKPDSIILITVGDAGATGINTVTDSISVLAFYNKAFRPEARYFVGKAVDPTRADSSLIRVRLGGGASAAY